MKQVKDLQEFRLDRPDWTWPSVELWLTIASTVTGVIGIILVVVNTPTLNTLVLTLVIIFVLSFFIVPVLVYVSQLAGVAYKRMNLHPKLFHELQASQDAVRALADQLEEDHFIEIHSLLFFKEKLHIVIRRNSAILRQGDRLVVIDKSDWYKMGDFVVTELREDAYLAWGFEVNPLWMGYVRNTGTSEMAVPANSAAMRVPEERFDD